MTMERCPYGSKKKRGAHDLIVVIPEDTDKPLTMVCDQCGMAAQYPLTWGVGTGSLDNLTAADIDRAVGDSWTAA